MPKIATLFFNQSQLFIRISNINYQESSKEEIATTKLICVAIRVNWRVSCNFTELSLVAEYQVDRSWFISETFYILESLSEIHKESIKKGEKRNLFIY